MISRAIHLLSVQDPAQTAMDDGPTVSSPAVRQKADHEHVHDHVHVVGCCALVNGTQVSACEMSKLQGP